MSSPDLARRSSGTRRSRPGAVEAARTSRLRPVPERVLRWQQQAGNRAVAALLLRTEGTPGPVTLRAGPRAVQRKDASHRENAPIASPPPSGSLDQAQWSAAYQAARAKPSAAAYAPLFRDVALTAGMDALGTGFVPGTRAGERRQDRATRLEPDARRLG